MQSTIWMALTSFHVTFQQSVIAPIDRQAAVDVPPYSPEKFKGGSRKLQEQKYARKKTPVAVLPANSMPPYHRVIPENASTAELAFSGFALTRCIIFILRIYRQPTQRRLRRLGKCYGKATTIACHACSQKLYDSKHGVSLQRDAGALLQFIRLADALPPSAVACCGSCITAFGIRSACG